MPGATEDSQPFLAQVKGEAETPEWEEMRRYFACAFSEWRWCKFEQTRGSWEVKMHQRRGFRPPVPIAVAFPAARPSHRSGD